MATFKVGDRVKVHIRRERAKAVYAMGCAAMLNGRAGTVEKHNPESMNGEPMGTDAFLVRFDEPTPHWVNNEWPGVPAFWFPPRDLARLAARAPAIPAPVDGKV